MRGLAIDLVLWLLASPILFIRWLLRLVRRYRFYRLAYTPRIECRNCGAEISLVNLWRCRCGFTSASHVMRRCPICGSLPRVVRCFNCGATERLPEP